MKITVFNGSPRAEEGNTNVMVQSFLEGARAAGAETENIFLANKKIHPCIGCFTCWIKTPGECVFHDDMAGLLLKLQETDVAVFATPLYVDNVTGIMKNFMDRMIPTVDPHFGKDESGECRHKSLSKVPKIAVISNSGFPEQTHFQVLRLLFKRIARNMSTEVIAEIYRGGGPVLCEKSFFMWLPLRHYKTLLRQAGEEIVKNEKLSEKLQAELEKPIISDEQYTKGANAFWDKELRKLKPQVKVGL